MCEVNEEETELVVFGKESECVSESEGDYTMCV